MTVVVITLAKHDVNMHKSYRFVILSGAAISGGVEESVLFRQAAAKKGKRIPRLDCASLRMTYIFTNVLHSGDNHNNRFLSCGLRHLPPAAVTKAD